VAGGGLIAAGLAHLLGRPSCGRCDGLASWRTEQGSSVSSASGCSWTDRPACPQAGGLQSDPRPESRELASLRPLAWSTI